MHGTTSSGCRFPLVRAKRQSCRIESTRQTARDARDNRPAAKSSVPLWLVRYQTYISMDEALWSSEEFHAMVQSLGTGAETLVGLEAARSSTHPIQIRNSARCTCASRQFFRTRAGPFCWLFGELLDGFGYAFC